MAREVLLTKDAPDVKLGLYQVILPERRGEMTDDFRNRMSGYCYAGRRGMYDELDYICPVLYQRFGPDDGTAEQVLRWFDGGDAADKHAGGQVTTASATSIGSSETSRSG